MADSGGKDLVSKSVTRDTGGQLFPRIRIKLRSMVRNSKSDSIEKKETPRLSNKERMRLYRQRVKENAELYQYQRMAANERNKQYRANLTESQKVSHREKTRLRVQKFRLRKKLEEKENPVASPVKKPKTRHQCQKLREQWRTSKQKQRASMSTQKKRRINEKRRQKYLEKKLKRKTTGLAAENISSTDDCDYNEESYQSKNSERKAVYRAKQVLPSAPQKLAKVIKSITEKATPRKRKALESEGVIYLTPSKRKRLDMNDGSVRDLTEEMHTNRRKRSRKQLQRRRLITQLMPWSNSRGTVKERKKLGVSWKFVTKASEVKGVWEENRQGGLDGETIQKVEDFFKSPSISACLPDKKLVSSKTMEPKRIMEQSLQMTYEQFKEKNPDCSVGFSKFAALRPKSVKTMKNNCFNSCLCEYCANIEMKAIAINKEMQGKGKTTNSLGFLTKYELVQKSLCPKPESESFYKKECINRTCDKCGIEGLKITIKEALASKSTVTWNRWENQTYTKQSTGKKTSRKMLRSKSGCVKSFLKELGEELHSYSSHLHNAKWQHDQFTTLIHELPTNWVVFCMDYAENYTCLYQDEAQGAHWSHDMVTLFSIVAYYRCNACEEIMSESLMFVSDDMKHDCHAVHHFVAVANDHLTKTRNLTIEREIHFSDGATSQFKSKTPFADVANSCCDFGFPCEKHFFGSRHGKGPCDGEFGIVKRTVSQGVVARQTVVRNAEEFYEFAKEKLTKSKDEGYQNCSNHKIRTFFYVKETEILRQRADRIDVKTVPETRKQHAIRPTSEGAFGVDKRTLSCFCGYCTGSGTEAKCQSANHVDNWKPHPKENKRDRSKTKAKSKGKTKKNDIEVCDADNEEAQHLKDDITDTTIETNLNGQNHETEAKCKSANHADYRKPHPKANKNKRVTKSKTKAKSKGKAKENDIEACHAENEEAQHSEINLNSQNLTRTEYFQAALALLQSAMTFKDLQKKCETLLKDQSYKSFKIEADNCVNIVDQLLVVDGIALDIFPEDKLPQEFRNRLPVRVSGDGNCLPRSISVACFGHENAHKEIRARIVVEMCTNVETYTDDEYLKEGNPSLPHKEVSNLSKTFAMFSEEYTPGDKLTKAVVQRVFEAEALEVVRDGAFMGIWQLFAAASIVGAKLHSVYPNRGDRLPKLMLNRTILPRTFSTCQSEIVIMWSSTREDLPEHNWIPNHFVPILPQCANADIMMDLIKDSFGEIVEDISLNDSLIADFIDQISVTTLSGNTNLQCSDELDPRVISDAQPQCSGVMDPPVICEAHLKCSGNLDPPYFGEAHKSPVIMNDATLDTHPQSSDKPDSPVICETHQQCSGDLDPTVIHETHLLFSGDTDPPYFPEAQRSPVIMNATLNPHLQSSDKTDPPVICETHPRCSGDMDPPYFPEAQRSPVIMNDATLDPHPQSSDKPDSPVICETHQQCSGDLDPSVIHETHLLFSGDIDPPYFPEAQRSPVIMNDATLDPHPQSSDKTDPPRHS